MAKIFMAYRFRGEEKKNLDRLLIGAYNSLRVAGYDIFCSYWMENGWNKQNMTVSQKMNVCLEELKTSDLYLPIVTSEKTSSRMEKESKRAVDLKKKYTLAIREGLTFDHFRKAAHEVIEYKDSQNYRDLFQKFSKLKV